MLDLNAPVVQTSLSHLADVMLILVGEGCGGARSRSRRKCLILVQNLSIRSKSRPCLCSSRCQLEQIQVIPACHSAHKMWNGFFSTEVWPI